MGGLTKKDILEAVGKVNEGLSEEEKISTEGGLLNIVEGFLDVVDSIPEETTLQDTVLDVFNTLVTIEKQSATALEELCDEIRGYEMEKSVEEGVPRVKENEQEEVLPEEMKGEPAEADEEPSKPEERTSDEKFESLKKKILAKDNSKLTYILDKMLLEGTTKKEMLARVSEIAKKKGAKVFTKGSGEITAFIKHRRKMGWRFAGLKSEADLIRLVGVR